MVGNVVGVGLSPHIAKNVREKGWCIRVCGHFEGQPYKGVPKSAVRG